MKRQIFGFLIFATLAVALRSKVAADVDRERPAENDVATDAEGAKLLGEWELASISAHGLMFPAPAGKGGSIVFGKDGKLIWKEPGKKEKIGTYKIDAGKEPKQIDLTQFKDGKVMQGIYEWNGDQLKMGLSADGPNGKRPSDFKGEKVMIVIWKRQKP